MNNRGDFFIGNKRVSSSTGQERTFDAPIATVTGEDPSRLSVIFDEVIIKERLVVEGGKSNTILTQFDGPVTFNKLVKLNDDLTVNGIMKLNNTFEITNTTQSTSKDDGAFVVEGGVGIERNLNVGDDLGVGGNIVATGDVTAVDGTFSGDLSVSGNAAIGNAATDTHTFAGTVNFNNIVNLNGGIDVDNIDIGGTGTENTITTDSGDLVLDAATGQSVRVNKTLSVSGNISGNRLDIDNIRIDGNTITTTDTDGDLILSTNGTGSVLINESITLGDANTETITVNARFASHLLPNQDDQRDLGGTNDEWRDLFIDGIARIDDLRADTANIDGGTIDDVTIGGAIAGAATFTIVDVDNIRINGNSILTTNNNGSLTLNPNGTGDVVISADLDLNGGLDVSGNTTLGNADTDTITTNAKFATSLIPNSATRDLGSSADEWRNLFITGIARIDDLRADTANIDGGNIDDTQIGAAIPSSGIFTLITVDNTNFNNNSIVTHSGTNADITLNPDGTGEVNIEAKLDVNGDLDVSGTIECSGTNDTEGINMSGMRINNCNFIQIDNINIDGNTITTSNNNGNLNLVPNGNGNVFVGTSNNSADLNVKGDVVAFHTSDITLKENITRIPDALDKVSSLSGNTFTWIQGHKYEGQDDTGVIAQEVEALGLPGLTTTREDGTKAVRYEKLIPVLIEAIKELKAEIDILKK
tara:strand:- start:1279 stop:3384 length:2106 start_codon:yes stop_codon:yes gene_type:complete